MSPITVSTTAASVRPRFNFRYNYYLCRTYSPSVSVLVCSMLNNSDSRLDCNSFLLNFSNSSYLNYCNGKSNALMSPHHAPAYAAKTGAKTITHLPHGYRFLQVLLRSGANTALGLPPSFRQTPVSTYGPYSSHFGE